MKYFPRSYLFNFAQRFWISQFQTTIKKNQKQQSEKDSI